MLMLFGTTTTCRVPEGEPGSVFGCGWVSSTRWWLSVMDARVGGSYRMSFTNFGTGQIHSFGGTYVELTPPRRIRYTDQFDDANLPGEMQVTVTLKKVLVGTDLSIVQDGVPDVIPLEACYLGWQESLRNLARLVEPNINQ